MFANSLTREVGLKVGPTMLEVLVRHYFDRLKNDVETSEPGGSMKQDHVLYDEAFTIVKSFLSASTFHTIEELQSFSNTRTPSPPWTHVVRVIVPMACCEEAASYLIKALGGEEVAKRLVGGVKWWQVRGVNGVDGQWITARKDWQEAKRRHKIRREREQKGLSNPPLSSEDMQNSKEGVYEKDMDAMRCILYLHGGGYYFGSVDQERYSIQRHARKINGRVFAINYRLAPQYPFPCGLQDAIAAYLYLIRPPADSAHQAVDPAHIIISGNSAGGGLSLALLQVIRDSGLPMPAGGVLISPWCDLTHSFPSVHINTDTDVVPESGLSFHKPSLLWPPPSEEISSRVHASIRFRIRQAFRLEEPQQISPTSTFMDGHSNSNVLAETDPTTPLAPPAPVDPENVVVQCTDSGEIIEVAQQLHFYTRNSLLAHPLVSPAMSYLGGLPPLLFIAGDKEVLRDEIIYTAHKAAYPEKYPATNQRWQPTSVHLQVYDDSPHILPVLFSFTTPAKFCFRAMASFCKFVTEMTPIPVPPVTRTASTSSITRKPISRRQSLFANFKPSTRHAQTPEVQSPPDITLTTSPLPIDSKQPEPPRRRQSLRHTLSTSLYRAGTVLRRSPSPALQEPLPENQLSEPANGFDPVTSTPQQKPSVTSSDVGPRFQASPAPTAEPSEDRFAGEIDVYSDITNPSVWECRMIRERVNTSGVIRPLEPESELDAFQIPSERVGQFSDLTIHRYVRDRNKFDKKFAHTVKSIDKHRRHNLQRAKEDTIKRMSVLRKTLRKNGKLAAKGSDKEAKEDVTGCPEWGWAWALDEGEDPPPSSIVSRRDTEEARKLAEIADQAILGEDHTFSGNNLWALVINFLTVTPGRHTHTLHKKPEQSLNVVAGEPEASTSTDSSKPRRHKSRLSRVHIWHKHRHSSEEHHT
ncbi:hypothetical protein BDZ97DRAFT_1939461 [Flammula alnicola]|nr:hypothetical protein BDZ97DRAFT_1939461 [Flammula alnicola]